MDMAVKLTTTGPLLEGKGPEVVQRNLESAITEAVMFLWPKILAATPKDTGILQQSILPSFEGKGLPTFKGIISTSQVYGMATELGRPPGKPVPKDLDLSGWIMRRFGVDLKEAQRLNFVVKRAIMRKGTIQRFGYKGASMFGDTLDANCSQLQTIFDKYGISAAKELNG